MEAKKSPAKDLGRLSNLFISLGFMLSLSLVLTAFEWKTVSDPLMDLSGIETRSDTEVLDIPVTEILPPKPVARPIILIETKDESEEALDLPPIDLEFEPTDDPILVQLAPPEEEESMEVISIAEESASPKGGIEAFYKFVADKLSGRYPPQARRMGIEGRVFVEFIVERDGSLTAVKASKGIGAGCDELAVKVVESAPRWNPGKQRGKPVRQRFTVPIIFKLG